jgi:hypothetical protein
MEEQIMREPARVLFHLNGYTKVLLERTEGAGMADGGIAWEISTDLISAHLRKIGSRFIVQYAPLTPEEMNNVDAIRGAKNRVEILEVNGE